MTKTDRNKFKAKRTISTRSFNANTDLLNKLINTSEVPHSTVSSPLNMSASNSSATAEAVIKLENSIKSNYIYFLFGIACNILIVDSTIDNRAANNKYGKNYFSVY